MSFEDRMAWEVSRCASLACTSSHEFRHTLCTSDASAPAQEAEARRRAEQKQKEEEERRLQRFRKRFKSSWDAVEKGGGRGMVGEEKADYLYELGASSNVNLNIDTAQNVSEPGKAGGAAFFNTNLCLLLVYCLIICCGMRSGRTLTPI
jgi:hypothetical protein